MIQQGKGADAGASFGSGASGSVFGSQGAGSFLTRTTAIFATLFFTTSLALAVMGGSQTGLKDIMAEEPAKKQPDLPLIPLTDMDKPDQAIPQVPDTKSQVSVQDNETVPTIEESGQEVNKNKTEEPKKK